MVAGVVASPRVSVPPEPWAISYLLGLSKRSAPIVWSPSSVTIAGELGSVSAPRKLAEAAGELGMPPSQLAGSFHEPPPSLIHCGGLLLRLRVATISPERRKVLSPDCT